MCGERSARHFPRVARTWQRDGTPGAPCRPTARTRSRQRPYRSQGKGVEEEGRRRAGHARSASHNANTPFHNPLCAFVTAQGGGPTYPYPKYVWSPAGGWWCNPRGWRGNTMVAGAITVGLCVPVGRRPPLTLPRCGPDRALRTAENGGFALVIASAPQRVFWVGRSRGSPALIDPPPVC